jgi:hypothetical protein
VYTIRRQVVCPIVYASVGSWGGARGFYRSSDCGANERRVALDARAWVHAETPAVDGSQRPEVALVQGQNVPEAMALGQNDDRCVGETYFEGGVAEDDGSCSGHVCGRERLELVRVQLHLLEQKELGRRTDTRG